MDQNYSTLKSKTIITPAAAVDLGSSTNRYGNLYLSGNINVGGTVASATTLNVPKIASIAFPTGATAADPAGGETVTITGSGFSSGLNVYIANVAVSSSTLTGSTIITFTTPAKTAGTYTFNVVNSDGGIAQYIPGITYDPMPVWSTTAGSLGSCNQLETISPITLSASENAQAITYSVTSGSLPSGLSLNSSGVISGTASSVSGSTTYNFTITATDPQGQKSARNFSYTVNKVCTLATGGTITTVGNYKIHTFTTSDTLVITQTGTPLEVLIVAGGGAGAYAYAGGGGAGGVLYGTLTPVIGSSTVTIGGGGTAPTTGNTYITSGSNSSVVFNSTTYTAIGGGYGGGWYFERASGGSGGGAGGVAGVGASSGGSATQTSQSPLTGYGNAGGGASRSSGQPGGGGGGAGAAGNFGGAGGAGIANPISGSTTGQLSTGTYYIAGGGGGSSSSGGLGGGGAGGNLPTKTAGSQNTGGGGGGGWNNDGGAAGGSGVVIFRYQYQ